MNKKLLLVMTLVFAFAALAADVTGKWTAQVPGRQGQTRETTFTLKADGDKLTGSMTGFQGNEIPIADGKVDGDTVSFTTTIERGGNTIKQTYTGKVAGDEIQFKREGGQGQPREFTAKRAK
jgi:hypothetical protein